MRGVHVIGFEGEPPNAVAGIVAIGAIVKELSWGGPVGVCFFGHTVQGVDRALRGTIVNGQSAPVSLAGEIAVNIVPVGYRSRFGIGGRGQARERVIDKAAIARRAAVALLIDAGKIAERVIAVQGFEGRPLENE